MDMGDAAWLAAACRAVNASDDYRDRAGGWRWPLGLAFLGAGDRPSRYARLDLHEGGCRGAAAITVEDYEQLSFRLAGSYAQWKRVLEGRIDPMRCLMTRQLVLDGDKLTVLRYLPAAKALMGALAEVHNDVTRA